MKVEINPDILNWTLKIRGISVFALQDRFPRLNEWLDKRNKPTYNQLVQLSKRLHIPFGYFFLSKPPEITSPIPHFRTVSGDGFQPSPDLLESIEILSNRQQWIKEYFMEIGYEPLGFVGSATVQGDFHQVAKQIRETIGINHNWASQLETWEEAFLYLLRQVEDKGIFVVVNGIVGNNPHRKLNVNEFRGFVLCDEYAPLIFVNGKDARSAQMFTVAHELAHIWLGKSASFDLRQLQPATDEVEIFCNNIAAEFLVPEKELKQIWNNIKGDNDIYQKAARHFKVSEIVTARRFLDLNLISRKQYFEFYNNYLQKEFKKRGAIEGGNFYAMQKFRIGHRFAKIIHIALNEGKLLYRDAYKLTGLHGRTFDNFIKKKIIS